MKDKIKIPILKSPKEISDLLISLTGVDIFEKTRVRHVIEHRAFFCYLLKEKFHLGPSAISAYIRNQPKLKTYDHATVIHALKMFKIYRLDKPEYFLTLETYFEISPDEDYVEYPKLEQLYNQYKEIKNKYKKANIKIDEYKNKLEIAKNSQKKLSSDFTINEIKYRHLDNKQRKIYDERVNLLLKSFEWKKPKNEYEIINCET
tara:strand:+ start:189 stop:800 length:612 start_codon:yes stop_codon:yes gene_type:complete